MLVAALAVPCAASAGAPAKRLRIAVLDIRPLATDVQKAELLNEIALTEAASMGNFDVIGKSDINAVIGFEKQKQVMGCSEDSTCLAEIGGALGVEYILVGTLGTIGDLFRLDLKLVEAKKARVRSRIGVTVEGKESKLVAAVQKAVRDLLNPLISTELTPPVVSAPPPPAKEKDEKAARATEKRDVPLPPPPVAAAQATRPGSATSSAGVSTSASSSRRTWAYVSGGAGLALLAGGAVFGLQAKSALDKEKKAATAGDLAAYDSNKSKAKSMSTLADVCFIGGAVGLGVGTWLFTTSKPAGVAFDLAPVPGGAVASISGGF
jgi:TolB-like protein